MKKILVTYATMAGSTAEVANTVGQVLTERGFTAEVLPLKEVDSLDGYDGVVVGAPMILGWHRSARSFIRKHRKEWTHIPLAIFATAMSLTRTGTMTIEGVNVVVDENLPKTPVKEGSLTFKERYATLENYLRPIFQAARPSAPVSTAVFGGRMEYGRLKWWAVIFAMVIVQAQAGDRRNWELIRSWAAGLPEAFQLEP